ncbi:MAG: phosphopentomutase [Bacilli bacterium]|nr:phosphopentomutase [Bacilli bacterium]
MKFKRVFLIVCDSLGAGEAIDASNYGDVGACTLGHINEKTDLFVPNLKKLGFLNTVGMSANDETEAYYTIARPTNKGKDTLSGHYEIAGVRCSYAFPTFPDGFPLDLIEEIQRISGRGVIGNISASGTEIIKDLGERQMSTGELIIYTSADSVLQVAAHEEIINLDELYDICGKIRELVNTKDEWRVGRIIARPYVGTNSTDFTRTSNRKDFACDPPSKSILEKIEEKKLSVISIGKIYDIFNGKGITKKVRSANNKDGVDKLLEIMDKKFTGLCFANLNDFDTLYGHRRDVEGYARAIEEFDVEIPMILNKLNNEDLLIITADHGNDPTFKGTDHTRENTPVIIYSRVFNEPKMLPIMNTFADIGATIAENFEVDPPMIGTSYLKELK